MWLLSICFLLINGVGAAIVSSVEHSLHILQLHIELITFKFCNFRFKTEKINDDRKTRTPRQTDRQANKECVSRSDADQIICTNFAWLTYPITSLLGICLVIIIK